MKSLICSLTFLLLLSGCGMTSISGFKNEDYKGDAISKVAVYCIVENLSVRTNDEGIFCNHLKNCGIEATPLYTIINPTKKLKLEEIYSLLNEKDLEALLVVKYGKFERVATPKLFSDEITYNPQAEHNLELIEVSSGEILWTAGTQTKGDAYESDYSMISSVARNSVDDLIRKGVLSSNNEQQKSQSEEKEL